MSRERPTIPVVPASGMPVDCPLAPPAHATVYARALHRACLVLGGLQALAQHLGVDEAQIRQWLTAEREMPHEVFVAAVEIILLQASDATRPS